MQTIYGCVSLRITSEPLCIRFLYLDLDNLSQKINAKMGGINGVANLKAALRRPSNEDLFMFFGADVREKYD